MVQLTLGSNNQWQASSSKELDHPKNEATKLLNFFACPDEIHFIVMHKVFFFMKEDGTITSQILEDVDPRVKFYLT